MSKNQSSNPSFLSIPSFYSQIHEASTLAQKYIPKLESALSCHENEFHAQTLINYFHENQRLKKLSSFPVSTLNRSKNGIRINSLLDAGFKNLFQLKDMTIEDYLLIPGIGRKTAEKILLSYTEILNHLPYETITDLNHYPPDVIGPIILDCYRNSYLKSIRLTFDKLFKNILENIKKNYQEIAYISSPAKWFFLVSKSDRQHVYENALHITSVLNEQNQNTINQVLDIQRHISLSSIDDAYNDYNTRKAAYFNCIVLGYAMEPGPLSSTGTFKINLPSQIKVNRLPSYSWSAIASFLALFVVIVFSFVHIQNIQSDKLERYNEAIAYVESEEYSTAKSIFNELSDYRDSIPLASFCKYASMYNQKDTPNELVGIPELSGLEFLYDTKFENDVDDLINHIEELQVKRGKQEFYAQAQTYANKLPELGMSEKFINYTKLGAPLTVKKCLDFDCLVPRARSKQYIWGSHDDHDNYFQVTISYREHFSPQVDDYIDHPDGEGYVSSITYVTAGV